MFVGESHLVPGCLGQEVDDDLPHLLTRPPVKVAHAFHVAGDKAGVLDAGLLAQLPARGDDRVFTFFNVALGEIPVRTVVEEEVFAVWPVAKEDHAGGDFVSHGAYIPRAPRCCQANDPETAMCTTGHAVRMDSVRPFLQIE